MPSALSLFLTLNFVIEQDHTYSIFIDNGQPNFTLTRTDPVKSGIRQRYLFYQIKCRVQIGTLFCNVLSWFFQSFCHLMAAFEI
jgi:hypothetical protein